MIHLSHYSDMWCYIVHGELYKRCVVIAFLTSCEDAQTQTMPLAVFMQNTDSVSAITFAECVQLLVKTNYVQMAGLLRLEDVRHTPIDICPRNVFNLLLQMSPFLQETYN